MTAPAVTNAGTSTKLRGTQRLESGSWPATACCGGWSPPLTPSDHRARIANQTTYWEVCRIGPTPAAPAVIKLDAAGTNMCELPPILESWHDWWQLDGGGWTPRTSPQRNAPISSS